MCAQLHSFVSKIKVKQRHECLRNAPAFAAALWTSELATFCVDNDGGCNCDSCLLEAEGAVLLWSPLMAFTVATDAAEATSNDFFIC